jgi:hypothetical protein
MKDSYRNTARMFEDGEDEKQQDGASTEENGKEKKEHEFVMEGYNIVFDKKVMLTPVDLAPMVPKKAAPEKKEDKYGLRKN